jgi:hypothetical protein
MNCLVYLVAGFLFEVSRLTGALLVKAFFHLLDEPLGHGIRKERLSNHFMNHFELTPFRMFTANFLLPNRAIEFGDLARKLKMLLLRQKGTEQLFRIAPCHKQDVNRFNDLYGAASAAQMAGESAKAKNYYSKLRENCPPAADRPELRNVPFAAGGPAELEKRQQRFTPAHHSSHVEEGVCSRETEVSRALAGRFKQQ